MKKHLTAAVLASTILIGTTGLAHAQAASGHGKTEFEETYDSNGDGKVTREEFSAERAKHFKTLDLNGDGKVDEAEYVGEYVARLDKELAKDQTDLRERQIKQAHVRFGVLDTNKDAALSAAEFDASGDRMFSRLDTNGDGAVDAADTAKAY